ncbi:right-handed parallel beta-helix repeat-containing protein [Candidatus Woesearchaeota archaeon]|nr:right-handed parallel beta-helix repeat-containing protein [Candidatus Woesearchaeota archaeon]
MVELEVRRFLMFIVLGFFIFLLSLGYLNQISSFATLNGMPFKEPHVLATPVVSCTDLNLTDTVYELQNNVTSNSTCFSILANNVTLDCKGFEINYSTNGALGYGINNPYFNLTTIQNCIIIEGGGTSVPDKHGLRFYNASNFTIFNNTIYNYGYASVSLFLSSTNFSNVSSNLIFISHLTNAKGILLEKSSSSIISSNNFVVREGGTLGYGIQLLNSTLNILTLNIINRSTESFFGYGIKFEGESNLNNITSNQIDVVGWGIYMTQNPHSNNVLSNNLTIASQYGIYLSGSNSNISSNIINTNGDNGFGIYLSSSSNSTITSNTINTTGTSGYGIYLFSISNSTINSNRINTLGTNGYGVYLSSSSNSTITSNTINTTGTSGYGVYLTSSNNSNVSYNLINLNGTSGAGIVISGSNWTTINSNTINTTGTSGYGIYLSSILNSTINSNRINTFGSSAHGIYFSKSLNSTLNSNIININGTSGYGVFFSESSFNSLYSNQVNSSKTNSYFFDGNSTIHYNHTMDVSNLAEGLPTVYNFSIINENLYSNTDVSDIYGQLICARCNNVTYNNVTMGMDGINLFNTTNSSVYNCNISTDRGWGLFFSRSVNINVSQTKIVTTGFQGQGAYIHYSSEILLSNVDMRTTGLNGHVMRTTGMTNLGVIDSSFDSNMSELFVESSSIDSVWNFTNVTKLDGSQIGINWSTGTGILNINWYLEAYANYTNSSNAVGVNITAWNNSGVMQFFNITGNDGRISKQILLGYFRSKSMGGFGLVDSIYYPNYTFNASGLDINRVNQTETLTQSWNITSNKLLTFTFGIVSVTLFCGDGICNNGETCSTCSVDCGNCQIPDGGIIRPTIPPRIVPEKPIAGPEILFLGGTMDQFDIGGMPILGSRRICNGIQIFAGDYKFSMQVFGRLPLFKFDLSEDGSVYCPWCYNGRQDYDEQGIDCGPSCKSCSVVVLEKPTYSIDYWNLIMPLLFLLIIFILLLLSRKRERKMELKQNNELISPLEKNNVKSIPLVKIKNEFSLSEIDNWIKKTTKEINKINNALDKSDKK